MKDQNTLLNLNYENTNNTLIKNLGVRFENNKDHKMRNEKSKSNKKKKNKRVKFHENFINIVDIESYKLINAILYYEFQYVKSGRKKSLCRELCNIQ